MKPKGMEHRGRLGGREGGKKVRDKGYKRRVGSRLECCGVGKGRRGGNTGAGEVGGVSVVGIFVYQVREKKI